LITTSLGDWQAEAVVLDYGTIVYCLDGEATITVNFTRWHLYHGAVITLFPNDVVQLSDVSPTFRTEALAYSSSLLREASLQLERVVYDSLRSDRCRTDAPIVSHIIENMFALLRLYFEQPECTCLPQMVLLQLKSFFLGFYDYLYRHPSRQPEQEGSHRAHDLFQRFMVLLERDYMQFRDVAYYANAIHITPKYLNTIVRTITNHSTKEIIDGYVIMQMKLLLRTTQLSIKEISCEYHFSSFSFFCRYFHFHTGMSPKQYKESIV
jgi:AraC-like DNA-binding protein